MFFFSDEEILLNCVPYFQPVWSTIDAYASQASTLLLPAFQSSQLNSLLVLHADELANNAMQYYW